MTFTLCRLCVLSVFSGALAISASAQNLLFDFNNAPLHSPFPVDVTVGGVTAHLSGTGQSYSIQDTSAPVVPIGFTGRFIYPSSVFPADLLISFDHTLTAFSILYAPQELACDDSATMRVTASRNGTFVGTNTHTAANPGTWPVDTLSCAFPQGFDSVVVHWDSRPPTCSDYGPIFLADDMRITALIPVGTSYCFGDGSALPCPCVNDGSTGNGCANSFFASGANLRAFGTASVAADSVRLDASNMSGSIAIFFQGTASTPPTVIDDGLGCVGGPIVRLGNKPASGTSSYPQAGDASISVRGGIPAAGGTFYYQCFYRNAASAFCPPATSNRTNGMQIAWTP